MNVCHCGWNVFAVGFFAPQHLLGLESGQCAISMEGVDEGIRTNGFRITNIIISVVVALKEKGVAWLPVVHHLLQGMVPMGASGAHQ